MRIKPGSGATVGSRQMVAIAMKAALAIAFVVLCAVLLRDRLADVTLADVTTSFRAIPAEHVLLAFAFGLLSHLALAGYDMLAFTRIGRKVPWSRGLTGGFAGTVMSQVVGFGLITGSYARARIYRANGIRWPEAVVLSGFVAAGFFLGLGTLLAVLLAIDPSPAATVLGASEGKIQLAAVAVLAAAALAAAASARKPLTLRLGRITLRAPDGKWLGIATGLATADLVPAALCLAVLLPEVGMPGLAAFIAIYVAGVALGHMLGSPGAAGPFEGVVFLALPGVPAGELAAAILMYRLVYYLPPFAIALGLIARAKSAPPQPVLTGCALRDRVDWILDGAGQAEAELALLGDKHIYCPDDADGFVMYGISGRVWLIVGDPVGPVGSWDGLIDGLQAEARATGARLAVYKATEAAHDFWNARGYRLQSLGQEGALALPGFSIDGSKRRELRRKCRTVEKAGVRVEHAMPGEAPLAEMADIAEQWRAAKGGLEQTFSMGHWSPAFVSRHAVVSAWVEDRLVAFMSVWISGDGREWMLDLMRQSPEAPNGTMHQLGVAAAQLAAENGAARFNLCMAPLSGLDKQGDATGISKLADHIYRTQNHRHGLQGMRRFKESFRPDWLPRYLAAPNWLLIAEAALAARVLVRGEAQSDLQATDRSPRLDLAAAPQIVEDLDADLLDTGRALGPDPERIAAAG